MSELQLINGQYLNPEGNWIRFETITINDGLIKSIDDKTRTNIEGPVIDLKGSLLLPGLIDLNANLREPGDGRSGNIASETHAAAANGVTHLCSNPDSTPINDSKAVTKLIREQSKSCARCRVLPLGALTRELNGNQLANLAALKDAGCVGASNAHHALHSLLVTQRCFEYAKTQDLPLLLTPIEPSLYQGCMHEGPVSTAIGLQGIPSTAESIAVSQLIQLAEYTGARLHLSLISSEKSVQLIAEAKAKGIPITADVAIANLLFTHQEIYGFDSLYHCHPPLRDESDRRALLEGVASGTIDAVTSGHRPVEEAEKLKPFAQTAPGMNTLDTLLSMAIKLEENDELSFVDFVNAMSTGAAKVLGFDTPSIQVGSPANLFALNKTVQYEVTAEELLSKGKNSPYLGQTLTGKVLATICEGELVYQWD